MKRVSPTSCGSTPANGRVKSRFGSEFFNNMEVRQLPQSFARLQETLISRLNSAHASSARPSEKAPAESATRI